MSLDSYDVIRELGRGGTAVVHLARQRDLGRLAALKELAGLNADDPSFAERFLRESPVAGSLNRESIVTVCEYFTDGGTPFIAMELMEGRRVELADFGIAKAALSGQKGLTSEGNARRGTQTAPSELHEVASLPLADRQIVEHESAVAAVVGFTPAGPLDRAVRVESFEEFSAAFGDSGRPLLGPYVAGGKLAHAVRGFFRNGGQICWVARAAGVPGTATTGGHLDAAAGLRLLAPLDEPTIIAAPDCHGLAGGAQSAALVQRELVRICERVVGRIALVDPPAGLDARAALEWRTASHIDSPSAAAYHPWVAVVDPATGASTAVPPSGHAAGLWARVDERTGPHQAPTAEVVLATDGPVAELSASELHQLNRAGVNCLRAWPGPELRAWGACTMSRDPELRYLHRQRIVGHLAASIAQGTRWAADEPNDSRLHERLRTVVRAFLHHAWRNGALEGDAPAQAFFVRCDEELNDEVALVSGDVVVEVGLSVRRGREFRALRIAHHDLPA